jgi:dienelactone hydrolase
MPKLSPRWYMMLPIALATSLSCGAFHPGLPAESPHFVISAETSLVDVPVRVALAGLRAGSTVSISTRTAIDGSHTLQSEALFVADGDGMIDLSRTAPLRGSYHGVDAMGLFVTMQLHTARSSSPVTNPWAPPAPFAMDLEARMDSTVIARATLIRRFVASSVERRDVTEGGVIAHLYLPKHDAGVRLPLVITLTGSEGGFDDMRAGMLASHGFATLAVAYFNAPGLPDELFEIPIETIERAVIWAKKQSMIDGARIGIIGASKGAELALVSASLMPDIHAVVAIAVTDVIAQGIDRNGRSRATSSWTWRGAPLAFLKQVPPPEFNAQFTQHGPPYRLRILHEASRRDTASLNAAKIHVEQIRGPVLLISGEDDQLGPSGLSGDAIVERMLRSPSAFTAEHIVYPGAGHQILLPYLPTPPRNAGQFWSMGGTDEGYAKADVDSWSRVLAFFGKALTR